jgi:Rod binding domain-containing protein
MPLAPISPGGTPGAPAPLPKAPTSPEEAARAFEAILVRQMVDVMTRDLFKTSLAEGSALTAGSADAQRDAMAQVLTDYLVEGGALRLRDLLLRQWGRTETPPPDGP